MTHKKCTKPQVVLVLLAASIPTVLAHGSESFAARLSPRAIELELLEEASIGVNRGDEAYMFGQVRAITASETLIFVLDGAIPLVRAYDYDGHFVRNIGVKGLGPGEYSAPRYLAADGDGDLLVHDRRALLRFREDGRYLDLLQTNVVLGPSSRLDIPVTVTRNGTLFVPEPTDRTGRTPAEWSWGMVPYSFNQEGGRTVEVPTVGPQDTFVTLHLPAGAISRFRAPFASKTVWSLLSDGSLAVGHSGEYEITIFEPNGVQIHVTRADWKVPILPGEAAWYRRYVEAIIRRASSSEGWSAVSMPTYKPAFEALLSDDADRLWVLRPGPGKELVDCNEEASTPREFTERPCWIDTYVLDAFESDGNRAMTVEAPPGFSANPLPFIRRGMVFAHYRQPGDVDDVSYVKRYRIPVEH